MPANFNQHPFGLTSLSGLALAFALTLTTSVEAQYQQQPSYAFPPASSFDVPFIGEIPGSARFLDDPAYPQAAQSVPSASGPVQIPTEKVYGNYLYLPGEVVLPAGEIPGSIEIIRDPANPGYEILQGPTYQSYVLPYQQQPQVVQGEIAASGSNDAANPIAAQLIETQKQIASLKKELTQTRRSNELAKASAKTSEATKTNLENKIAELEKALQQSQNADANVNSKAEASISKAEKKFQKLATERDLLKKQLAEAVKDAQDEKYALKVKLANAIKTQSKALQSKLAAKEKELKESREKMAELSKATDAALQSSADAIKALKVERMARIESEKKLAAKTEGPGRRKGQSNGNAAQKQLEKLRLQAEGYVKEKQDGEKQNGEMAKKKSPANSAAQKRLQKLNLQAEKFAKDQRDAEMAKKRAAQKLAEDKAAAKAAKARRQAEIAKKRAAQKLAEDEKAAEAKAAAKKKSTEEGTVKRSARRKGHLSTQDQIKKLRSSMDRQIKRANEQIKSRTEDRVAALIEDGKSEDSNEVQELNDFMKKSMQENEAKIRRRIEERIRKIQKEAGARDRS